VEQLLTRPKNMAEDSRFRQVFSQSVDGDLRQKPLLGLRQRTKSLETSGCQRTKIQKEEQLAQLSCWTDVFGNSAQTPGLGTHWSCAVSDVPSITAAWSFHDT
jgi:hypothetical protein